MCVIMLIELNHVANSSTLQQDRASPTEWHLRTICAFKFGFLWYGFMLLSQSDVTKPLKEVYRCKDQHAEP